MPSTNKRLRFSFYIIARKSSGISGLSFQVDLQNQIEKNFTYKLQNSTAVDVIMLYIGKVDQKSAAAAVSDLFSYPDAAVPHHVYKTRGHHKPYYRTTVLVREHTLLLWYSYHLLVTLYLPYILYHIAKEFYKCINSFIHSS